MHEWLRMRGSSVKGASKVLAMSVSSSSPSPSRNSSCALVGAGPPPKNCCAACCSRGKSQRGGGGGEAATSPPRRECGRGAPLRREKGRTHGTLAQGPVLLDLGPAGVHLLLNRLDVLDLVCGLGRIVVGCSGCTGVSSSPVRGLRTRQSRVRGVCGLPRAREGGEGGGDGPSAVEARAAAARTVVNARMVGKARSVRVQQERGE